MTAHPYRTRSTTEEPAIADGFEERAVALVLMLAGALGLAVGATSPSTNAVELVLGIALLAVGGRTYLRSRIEPVL